MLSPCWSLRSECISTGLVTEVATGARRRGSRLLRQPSEGGSGVLVLSASTLPEASATASFTSLPWLPLAQHSAWHRQDLINVYLLKE